MARDRLCAGAERECGKRSGPSGLLEKAPPIHGGIITRLKHVPGGSRVPEVPRVRRAVFDEWYDCATPMVELVDIVSRSWGFSGLIPLRILDVNAFGNL